MVNVRLFELLNVASQYPTGVLMVAVKGGRVRENKKKLLAHKEPIKNVENLVTWYEKWVGQEKRGKLRRLWG